MRSSRWGWRARSRCRCMIRGPLGTGLTLPVFKEVLIPFGFAFPLVGMFVMVGSEQRGEFD